MTSLDIHYQTFAVQMPHASEGILCDYVTALQEPDAKIVRRHERFDDSKERVAELYFPDDISGRILEYFRRYLVRPTKASDCHTFLWAVKGWTDMDDPQMPVGSGYGAHSPFTEPEDGDVFGVLTSGQVISHSLLATSDIDWSISVAGKGGPLALATYGEITALYNGVDLVKVDDPRRSDIKDLQTTRNLV